MLVRTYKFDQLNLIYSKKIADYTPVKVNNLQNFTFLNIESYNTS